MKVTLLLLLSLSITRSSAGNGATKKDGEKLFNKQRDNKWFSDGEDLIKDNLRVQNINKKARGVILFLGDGMGVSTVTAARILDGQMKGMKGEENVLSWEKFANVGLSKTYNTDKQVSDSAGTATAYLTGAKSYFGAISVNENVTRGECGDNVEQNSLLSILELAEMEGLSTGVVTTTRVTHATPAAAYAHSSDRNFERDTDCSKDCLDIARQLIEFPHGNGPEVVLGGGRSKFQPWKRNDKRNLIEEWKAKSANGRNHEYVKTKSELKNLDPLKVDHVLGLFHDSHMNYYYDRMNGKTDEPSLVEMTEFAIKVLQKNEKGFFLLVEGGRIDHGHHANEALNALYDTVEFNKAVETGLKTIDTSNTLVMVTADHSHVFTMAGYPDRGNFIFGFAGTDKGGSKYTTLGYQNGPGAGRSEEVTDRKYLEYSRHKWRSLVMLDSETHGGEDVAIYAQGPQAHLVRGVVEQNYIFHVMDYALCLTEGKKRTCIEQGLINPRTGPRY